MDVEDDFFKNQIEVWIKGAIDRSQKRPQVDNEQQHNHKINHNNQNHGHSPQDQPEQHQQLPQVPATPIRPSRPSEPRKW